MIVAAETCDCVGPMINSGWLIFFGTVAVVGPALVASVVRHRRRRADLPADDPLLASSGQSTAGDARTHPQPGADLTAGRKDHAAPPDLGATASTETPPQDVG